MVGPKMHWPDCERSDRGFRGVSEPLSLLIRETSDTLFVRVFDLNISFLELRIRMVCIVDVGALNQRLSKQSSLNSILGVPNSHWCIVETHVFK